MSKSPPRNPTVMPAPPQQNESAGSNSAVSKTPPMAEIILFPNAKEMIAGVPEAQADPHTRTRWLQLADEALESDELRKKAR